MKLTQRTVGVIGAGESGAASAKLLQRQGARVRVSSVGELPADFKRWCESHHISYETGAHTEAFLRPCDLLIVSPGVKPTSPVIQGGLRRRTPVWSEIELAGRLARGKIAAVTGTNGKTTTSTILWEMIRRHRACDLCGNIGKSLAASVLEKGPAVWRVVEVSSFQMKYIDRFRPDVAVVLNLSPNHLDWHPDLKDYYQSKLRIGKNQTRRQALVLNADDAVLRKEASRLKGRKVFFGLTDAVSGRSSRAAAALGAKTARGNVTVENGEIVELFNGKKRQVANLKRFRLPGRHNVQNALAATAAALALGVSRKAIQGALDAVRPLPHRVEEIGQARGVRFVNDSKSTTAMSTAAAIRGFDRGVILVAGGRRKQDSFREVYPEVRERVDKIVFYGEAADSLHGEFGFFKNRTVVRDFEGAVRRAFASAVPGQVVLLSPMCSSFDQFSSYRDRGDTFRRIVEKIAAGK